MLKIQRHWPLRICFTLGIASFSAFCASAPTPSTRQKAPQATPKGIVVNRGLYMINSTVITEQDLANMKKKLRRLGTKRRLGKEAIASLIERALVQSEAEENSIIISEEKIKKEIEKLSLQQGLSPKRFRKKVEREMGLPFTEWVKELRYKLIKRQLIQIGLHVKAPTLSEVRSFYRKNRHRIGIELRYREMVFVPQSNSIQEETRISSIAKALYNKSLRTGQSFGSLAASSPHNSSPYKRRKGLVPYQSIYDIAASNPILASILYRSPPGRITRPFRDSLRRYMIVKVEKRRPLPLSKVKNLILNQIYAKKEMTAFKKWIAKKKKETVIVALPKK